MSKPTRNLVVAAIALAVGAGLIWRYARPVAIPVQVHAVARGLVEATVANTRAGTVMALRRARLSPAVGGQVAQLPVVEGDHVEKGAVLLELWNVDLRAQLTLQEREAERSRLLADEVAVRAAFAQREAERQQKLVASNVASEGEVDRAVSEAAALQAAHRAATAQNSVTVARIATIRAELERTVLLAPFAGIIAEVNAELGEFVTPSPVGIPTPPAVDLIDARSLYVTAPIDEVDAAAVRPGMVARIRLDAFPGRRFEGVVRRIAPYVLDREKQARTVDVEVDFVRPPADAHLLPGYSADAEIVLAVRESVLRVPTPGVMEDHRVLLLDEATGTLVERTFEAGLGSWEFMEATNGLALGDLIVLSLDRDGVEPGASAVREKAAIQ